MSLHSHAVIYRSRWSMVHQSEFGLLLHLLRDRREDPNRIPELPEVPETAFARPRWAQGGPSTRDANGDKDGITTSGGPFLALPRGRTAVCADPPT